MWGKILETIYSTFFPCYFLTCIFGNFIFLVCIVAI